MGLNDIRNYIIGVILFMVVITGGIAIIGGFYTINPALDPEGKVGSFSNTLNKSNEVTTSIAGIQASVNQINQNGAGFLGLGWLDALIGSSFNGLKAILGSISFMGTATQDSASLMGIPSYMTALVVLIVIVMVIFGIWVAVMRSPG